jgi:hypothetical protein
MGEELPVVEALDLLAFGAHPDDVERTCGGTLIAMAEQGYRTGIIDLTAGGMGDRGNPRIRIEEAEAAAKILLVAHRENLNMPDARLENSLAGRITIAAKIRELRPKTVILPYWQDRHPDHYRACEMAYEGCFLAGLEKLDPYTAPHRPEKVIYSSIDAGVAPSFVVDVTAQFERRLEASMAYESQIKNAEEMREWLAATARYFGNLIGCKYGEPFVVKDAMQVADVVALGVRTF